MIKQHHKYQNLARQDRGWVLQELTAVAIKPNFTFFSTYNKALFNPVSEKEKAT